MPSPEIGMQAGFYINKRQTDCWNHGIAGLLLCQLGYRWEKVRAIVRPTTFLGGEEIMARLRGWRSTLGRRGNRALVLVAALAFGRTVAAVVPKPAQEAGSAAGVVTCRYKFLVLDDTDIMKTHKLKRRVNAAVKHPQPVLRVDAPWHH